MSLFDGILLAGFADSILHRRRITDQRMRAMQCLLAECGPVQRFPEPPSPHRLLGEIARPLTGPARPLEFRSAMRRFQPSSRNDPE